MVNRSIAVPFRLCTVAALVVLGTTALLQVSGATPAAAPGSSVALLSWGDNSSGELGNGVTGGISDTPVSVSLPPGVTPVAIAGGGGGGDAQPSLYCAYAIGSDGNLYAWGDNGHGELGDGSAVANSSTPVVVSLPSGVTPTAISATQGVGYAIGSDGKLYAWGNNFYGNLGNGSTTDSSTPVVVSLPSGVTPTAIAGGYESAYAVGSDGKLYAWGDNLYGELGNGGTTNSDTPVVVSLPSGVTPKAIAGGGGTGYTTGSDGNLYAWGLNSYGELGNGSTTNSDTPVVVSLPSGVTPKAVTGGGGFAHAIGSDGNLYGWGLDSTAAQLGDGGSTNSDTPVVIVLASGITPTAIADNLHTGYAIGSDGKIYAWGYGLQGELGDGSPGNFSPPVVVSLPPGSTPESLGPEPGSSAGYAIVSIPHVAPTITTQPTSQSVFAGQDATFTAAASGYPAPTVQWQVSTDGGVTFSPVLGATSDTLTIAATALADSGNEYEAVFTNSLNSATTDAAVLTVNPDVAPAITTQPLSQSVYAGQTATFSAAASGTPAPTVQWQFSVDGVTWYDISASTCGGCTGINSDTYQSAPLSTFENGWQARAVFTNSAGSATTDAATVTVNPAVAPVVTTQPLNSTVATGQTATFTAAASGEPTPTVDWQISVDGGATWISLGALTGDTVTSGVLTAFENGWEARAVFTNGGGSAATNAATLTVT